MSPERIRAIWENEIDRLELEVIRVERLVRGLVSTPTEPWRPPAVPGLLPEDLVDRVTELLGRQEEAKEALELALGDAQRQIAYADHVATVTRQHTHGPVYLDLEA
jgi:hypothetical protein